MIGGVEEGDSLGLMPSCGYKDIVNVLHCSSRSVVPPYVSSLGGFSRDLRMLHSRILYVNEPFVDCLDAIISIGIVWWGSVSASVPDPIFTIPAMVVSSVSIARSLIVWMKVNVSFVFSCGWVMDPWVELPPTTKERIGYVLISTL
ncbi:hypothetical protein L195_g024300 [Trifolium pratense]|uniref:Uncharacterized protein n=1 Tax=Trifolium pratense TaxID=57577 RepID=A0A2K3NDB2_TRIPR|nr:hypothetical protein L195_g024300 [Trifolium pratense]